MSQGWLEPATSLEDHARARLNCESLVGSLAFTQPTQAKAPIYPPLVLIDTVGAGDGLMAGVLTALLETQALTPGRLGILNEAALVSLRFGAADDNINGRRKGGEPPTCAEVDAVLAA